jgi:hypothetical protein
VIMSILVEDTVQRTGGPRVVLESQVPCAMNVDKAGEHVVHSRAMTRMADKIFVC